VRLQLVTSLSIASALLLALAPPGARAARSSEEGWSQELRLGLAAGYFSGQHVRRDSGGLGIAEVGYTPLLRTGDWKFETPLHVVHRQTFGAHLSETKGAAGAVVEWRATKQLRLGPEAGVSGAWRPGWPDLYQRQPDGTLPPTDRYSYFSWHAGGSLSATPFRHQHARLRYRYIAYRYGKDASFQQEVDPMHLTPLDHTMHEARASWRVAVEPFAAAARLEYHHRQDQILLARNAGTGTTSGYSNPLQRLDRWEPSVEVEAKGLLGRVDLSLSYGYLIQNDPFQGYYSFRGHHPRLQIEYAVTELFRARARAEAWIVDYGPNSTSPSRLTAGDHRFDDRLALALELAYRLSSALTAKLDARWIKRDTNYPDYVPGVLPAGRFFDIQWNYVNTEVLASVEYRR
jgi:hypothetical protein